MTTVRALGGPAAPRGTQPQRARAGSLPVPRWERLARTATGVGFACAAAGNVVGFLPRAGELLPWFADTAWLPPYPWVLHHLLPVAPLVVAAAAAFEAVVAGLLLGRRHEAAALALAATWHVALIPALGWPYWTVNVVLGGAVGWLAARAARSGPSPTGTVR